jgi:hypothetical protein
MDENATFEARAVLAPRRRRTARLALLVPALALVAVAWAGLSGDRSDRAIAEATHPGTSEATVPAAAPSLAAVTPRPARVIGLDVRRLDDFPRQWLGRDNVFAVAGWYVPTAITDCPSIDAAYRQTAPPELRAYFDQWAYCTRTGVLYASPPDVQDSWSGSAGLGAVAVQVGIGVVVPPELETIGAHATEVVVVGRFGPSEACPDSATCDPKLLIDYVGWTPGA